MELHEEVPVAEVTEIEHVYDEDIDEYDEDEYDEDEYDEGMDLGLPLVPRTPRESFRGRSVTSNNLKP